jgi:hypothetical protein
MPGNTQIGYGVMPLQAYLDKMEQTCIYEDPNQLENFFRHSLKDLTPDAPLFESDQPRRNNFSKDRLNLRHCGKRVDTEPDLPDGTFLDHHFLVKDPRGIATDPDMKQLRKQKEARGKFIKFYKDHDDSVPSEGRSQSKVIQDIKGAFYSVKERLKIFDDSLTGWHNGGVSQVKYAQKCKDTFDSDYKVPNMRDEVCGNRRSVINDLSNNTSIGWKRTTDHKFKVSHYSKVRKHMTKTDLTKNRANAKVEHDILVSVQDQVVPKSVSLKMIDFSRKRYNDIKSGSHVTLGESLYDRTRSKKLNVEDIYKIQQKATVSQEDTANALLHSENVSHMTGRNVLHNANSSNLMRKTVTNPTIVENMSSINRKMSSRERKDLREHMTQSDEYKDITEVGKNKNTNSKLKVSNKSLWKSNSDFDKGKSMNVANYSKLAKLVQIQNPKDHNHYDFEKYNTEQKTTGQRKKNMKNPELEHMKTTEVDNEFGDEVNADQSIGFMGSKDMRTYHEREEYDYNNLDEVIAKN